MGLTVDFVEFLLECRAEGRGLGDVLTLGRQETLLSPRQLRELTARDGLLPVNDPARFCAPNFADALLRDWLGATSVASLDRSGFEGATVIHDLNQPLDARFDERFDTVIDAGTLEHVFNVPVALAGMMRLVREGGVLAMCTPSNNLCGHGFYQFSPELFFRALAPENGYRVERMILLSHPYPSVELGSRHRQYEVIDPAVLGRRGLVVSGRSAYLMIAARRERAVAPFATMPQQSDYAARWAAAVGEAPASVAGEGRSGFARFARARAVALLNRTMSWSFIRGRIERRAAGLRNRVDFRRLR